LSLTICYGPQGGNCYTPPEPPFLPARQSNGQNTLVIPVQPPPTPPPGEVCGTPIQALTDAVRVFHEQAPLATIAHVLLFQCGAEVAGCDHSRPDPDFGPGIVVSSDAGFGSLIYDSDPNWTNLEAARGFAAGQAFHDYACGRTEIVFGPPPGGTQPPPPPDFCVAPCVLQSGICVCDPPIPWNVPPFYKNSWPTVGAEPSKSQSRVVMPAWFLALDPTRKRGIPAQFSCGCSDVGEFEELVT
jgi:hypothetical protein